MGLTELLSPLQLLAFISTSALLGISLVVYVLVRALRREPPGILRRSFFDATGQPNGVLLTVFNAVVILNLLTLNFIITGNSPTIYMWATWGTIVLFGIGADTAVTRAQIEASKSPDPGADSGTGLGGEGSSPPADMPFQSQPTPDNASDPTEPPKP